jgi:hypothetical protein
MTVNKEMAKRMDDSNSITACPRGELRSESGLEATVVMGCENEADTKRLGKARQKKSRPGKPALNQVISADAELCRKGMCFGLNPLHAAGQALNAPDSWNRFQRKPAM